MIKDYCVCQAQNFTGDHALNTKEFEGSCNERKWETSFQENANREKSSVECKAGPSLLLRRKFICTKNVLKSLFY